ncbi:MAG: D-aminoacyl-tRNA deacylase [Acidobacteriota bacterium]
MRAVVQRVTQAEVTVDGTVTGAIGHGMVVLVAVETGDGEDDLAFMAHKLAQLRIFDDEAGRMNRSIMETGGAILLVSQFTLYGDCRKGNRPSYSRAAGPEAAEYWYRRLADALREKGLRVETGVFRAMMQVRLVNDGPVTLILDSRKEFF